MSRSEPLGLLAGRVAQHDLAVGLQRVELVARARSSGRSCAWTGIDSLSPGAHARVKAVSALTTSTSTWRQMKRRSAFGSSAPGSRPASHSTWKPLQMPSTRPPSRANSMTDSITGEKRAIAPTRR